MNRSALSKIFHQMAFVAAVLPPVLTVYFLLVGGESLRFERLLVPVLICLVFLGCMITLVYIFNVKEEEFAVSVEKIRRDTQKRTDELNALREISDLIGDAVMPAEEMLSLLLEKTMQVIAVRYGSVFLVDPQEPEGLRLIAAKPPVDFNKENGGKPRRFSFVKSVIESGKALRIQNIEKDPRTMKTNDPKYGSPSFISMPIYKHQQVIAVMNLANKENGGIFTEGDERILTIMLSQIGSWIENASLQYRIKIHQADIKELQSRLKQSL